MSIKDPVYISVDIETTGTVPGRHAIVDLGAVKIPMAPLEAKLGDIFCRRLGSWIGAEVDPEAMRVHGIAVETLEDSGTPCGLGIRLFQAWVLGVAKERTPVFVGWNAAFDWSFLTWYFGRYKVKNPFHHAVLDIKALAAGMLGIPWEKFNAGVVRQELGLTEKKPSHSALQDAMDQGEIFEALMKKVPCF